MWKRYRGWVLALLVMTFCLQIMLTPPMATPIFDDPDLVQELVDKDETTWPTMTPEDKAKLREIQEDVKAMRKDLEQMEKHLDDKAKERLYHQYGMFEV